MDQVEMFDALGEIFISHQLSSVCRQAHPPLIQSVKRSCRENLSFI